MTLEELKRSDKPFLTPTDIAPILGCKPYSINVQAKQDITKLGFPAAMIGTRVKIPRIAFLNWMMNKED